MKIFISLLFLYVGWETPTKFKWYKLVDVSCHQVAALNTWYMSWIHTVLLCLRLNAELRPVWLYGTAGTKFLWTSSAGRHHDITIPRASLRTELDLFSQRWLFIYFLIFFIYDSVIGQKVMVPCFCLDKLHISAKAPPTEIAAHAFSPQNALQAY